MRPFSHCVDQDKLYLAFDTFVKHGGVRIFLGRLKQEVFTYFKIVRQIHSLDQHSNMIVRFIYESPSPNKSKVKVMISKSILGMRFS